MSRTQEQLSPVVPQEVAHYLEDEHIASVIAEWQGMSRKDLLAQMPDPEFIGLGDRSVRAVLLNPAEAVEVDETQVLVQELPHQQAWKPSMFMRTELTRQIVAPNARSIVFPNNSRGDKIEFPTYYQFTNEDKMRMDEGDILPLAELQTRVLEELKIGNIAITGYSLGGLTGLGLAAIGSPNITHVNADEAPSAERDAKQLSRDFRQSGGWGDQLAAIEDSGIPALKQELARLRLGRDYINFGLAMGIKENKALTNAMAGSAERLIERALANYPTLTIKLGHVVGSKLFAPESVSDFTAEQGVHVVEYSGSGTHGHPTGDNIVAHALMAKHGLDIVR